MQTEKLIPQKLKKKGGRKGLTKLVFRIRNPYDGYIFGELRFSIDEGGFYLVGGEISCLLEVGSGKIGVVHIGVFEIGTGEIAVRQVSGNQLSIGEVGTGKICVG